MGWDLALVVPLATASALALRRGYFALVGATILIAAIIYTGSRSSMAIAGLGIVISVLLLLANRRYRNLVIQRLILVISLTIGVLIYFWNDVILLMENFEFYFRIAAAISNQSNSGDIRMRLIQRAFECYQNDSLIFGMGVKNIVACIGQDTTLSKDMVVHNDFVSVLTDTGILGAVTYCAIFLVIIFVMAKKLKMLKFVVSWGGGGLIGSTVAGIVSLNFTTGYNSPLLWTILSLALVALPQPRPSDRKLVKQDLMPHQG